MLFRRFAGHITLGVMKQTELLEFKSTAFAAEPGEDAHTNPGIFGKGLAQWLANELRAKGVAAGEVIPEDFGWCVPVESAPHALFVVCANAEDQPNRWRVFAFAEGGLLARILGKDERARSLASLFGQVKSVLQASPLIEGVSEVVR